MKTQTVDVRRAETSWGQKIAKAREIRGRNMGLMFDRATLLSEVYEDQEFLDTFASLDDAIDALNIEVADSCCDWIEFYGIYKMFPDRKAWVNGNLQDLRAQREVAEKERRIAARQDEGLETPKRTRATATIQEVEELRSKVAELRASSDHERLMQERLLQENADLRKQLHIAQGRIEELERRSKVAV